MPEPEEPLYVGIAAPIDVRKDLLYSSKILLGSLRGFEKIEAIRKEKERHMAKLSKTMREIGVLNRRLKQILPKTTAKIKIKEPLQYGEERQASYEMPAQYQKQASSRIIEEKTRLAELEEQLVKVEEKLKKLE